ncbi:MAG: DUF4494 family protein, partial [Putridiphycobacter sp.]|nr:DUF4494 family protein [Putridiphycobacter sp.]
RGEFRVTSIAPFNITDVIDYEEAETWWKVKVSFKDIDADSGKAKTATTHVITNAENSKTAYNQVEEALKKVLPNFKIKQITETSIVEVFAYKSHEVA